MAVWASVGRVVDLRDRGIAWRERDETRSFTSERFGVETFGLERFNGQRFRSERFDRRLGRQQGWHGSAGADQFDRGAQLVQVASPERRCRWVEVDNPIVGLRADARGRFVRREQQQRGQMPKTKPLPFAKKNSARR
jgi:hypothetical protein